MKPMRCVFLVVAFIFGSVPLLVGSTVTKEFKERVYFPAGGEVLISNVNGNITVGSWDRDSVDVFAEIEVRSKSLRDAETLLEKVRIDMIYRSGYLSVEPDYPEHHTGGGILDWIFGRKAQVKVQFWIRVPSKTDCRLKSVNGRIRIKDVEGRAVLATTNGSVEASDLKGTVDAHTVNGGIQVGLRSVDRNSDMAFRTTNGGIKLTLPSDVQAEVKASTVNGNISTDFPMDVRGKFNRKHVSGRIGSGGAYMELHTVNGSIHIYKE